MSQLSAEARNLNWFVSNFARSTPGVAHAAVVTSDGLLIAASERLDRERADQLAAITSGLVSLAAGAATHLNGGTVKETVVDMEEGFLFVMTISDGSCLSVIATKSCEISVVAYGMAVLVARASHLLTPTLRAELQAALQT
ncbi:MAG TPA: roadblock/LC7 domain-containing protein [Actinomycetes bacterium]